MDSGNPFDPPPAARGHIGPPPRGEGPGFGAGVPPPPGYEYPPGHQLPKDGRATAAFVCGILGFLLPLPLSILAWVLGAQSVKAIDRGEFDPDNRGLAQAGRVLGIVVCSLFVVGLLGLAALLLVMWSAYQSMDGAPTLAAVLG